MSVQLLTGTVAILEPYVLQDFQAVPVGDLGTNKSLSLPGAISNGGGMSLGTPIVATY
jgi:hypothetical protein